MKLKEIETKLNLLNDTLIEEEKRVFKTVKNVIQIADNLLNNGEISDYYFDLEVQGFKSNEEEDSFFKSKTNMLVAQLRNNKEYKNEDYTETLFLSFKGFNWNNPHCITFHDLCCHSDIKIEEIIEISEIWLEFKINYQFITKY